MSKLFGGERNVDVWRKANFQVPEYDSKMPPAAKKYNLKYIYSAFFATALEDSITAARLLIECNGEMHIKKALSDMSILLAKKFSVAQPAVTDDLDGIDVTNLKCDGYKLDKLENDKLLLHNILIAIYLGLSLDGSWKSLVDKNNDLAELETKRVTLVEEESKNRTYRHELIRQLRQQRNHIKSVTYDTNVIIERLKSKVEDSTLNAEVCSRYMDGWQRARTEQHIQTIHDAETPSTTAIEFYKRRADGEQRVHSEIELLLNIKIGEILEKVESWMTKYDKDMEKLELRIQHKQTDYQKITDKRMELEARLEKHQQLLENWQKFKNDREEARLFKEKMNNAAVTVQSWWRGLLVRLELGPYKPQKKSNKPAEKEKKKKK